MSSMLTPSAMIVGAAVAIGSVLAVLDLPGPGRGPSGQMAILLLQSAVAAPAAPDGATADEARESSPFDTAANQEGFDDPFGDIEDGGEGFGELDGQLDLVEVDPAAGNSLDNANNSDATPATASANGSLDPTSEADAAKFYADPAGDSGVVDLSGALPKERQIRAALTSPLRTPIDAVQQPLAEVVDQLVFEYDIPILFDTAGLNYAEVSPDTEITINLRDVSLKSALRLILKQTENLTYVIQDEVLLITTTENAESMLATRIYDIRDLGVTPQEIVDTMPLVLCRDSWEANGTGQGEVAAIGQNAVAVLQTQRAHEEVVDFLEQLYRLSQRSDDREYAESAGGGMF